MPVVLAEIVQPEQIILELSANEQSPALREVIATMKLGAPEKFFAEVLAREGAHTTYMGKGVAFPHARTDLVEKIVLGIGRSHEGVIFGKEGERAQLLFVIGVPRRMVGDYLVCVGALARLVNDSKTRAALMAAPTTAEFAELIRAGSLVLE